jgi:sugar phosphate isomerase/epimerase
MGIIVGSLAGQNWHRQVRRAGLGPKERFEYVFNKTAQAAKEFGFSPMGIDFGAGSLISTDRSYLDELKARLKENDLFPMCGFGGVVCSYDAEVRAAALSQAMKGLEVAAYLGAKVSNFGTQRNGRVTRTAQLLLAVERSRRSARRPSASAS